MSAHRPVIGWRERVELPAWGLKILAKIDTGARSSSIDVAHIEHVSANRIRFQVRKLKRGDALKTVEADIHGVTRVKSSNGQVQERYTVLTELVMAGVRKTIRVSLTCRKKMLHRMLLGRDALEHDFLIDAAIDRRKESPRTRRSKVDRKKTIR